MLLYFIRHGESEANQLNEFSNGLNKHPLTEKGRQQAHDLAARFVDLPITACYSSPILRAVETASILCTELGITYQVTEALREFDVGVLEGKSDDQSWRRFWLLMDDWFERKEWDRRIEGGENFWDIRRRFVPFIEGLVKEFDKTPAHLLLVSHGGTLRCMLPLILRNIDFPFVQNSHVHNTDVIVAESTPEGLVCRSWGEVKL